MLLRVTILLERHTVSLMSIFAPYGTLVTAGSQFKIYAGVSASFRYAAMRCINVVFPDPAMPVVW